MRPLSPIAILTLVAALSAARAPGQIALVGDLSNDRHASPGDVYEGSFTLRNDGSEPAEAKVYQTDYTFSCDGSTQYGEPGRLPRSNARWIEFRPQRQTIPPRSSVTVHYTVKVPTEVAGSSPIGCYWSMLMAEEIPAGSAESSLPPTNQRSMGVRQTIRYGIQIATHIAGTGSALIRFSDPQLVDADSSHKALHVSVTNAGETWLRPDFYVEIFDPSGRSHGRIEGSKFRMYPGTCVRQQITLPHLPHGEYTALVVADAGGEQAFGAQYTVKL